MKQLGNMNEISEAMQEFAMSAAMQESSRKKRSSGVVMHISHLKVGDVVRPLRGPLEKVEGAPPISYTLADGSRRVVESTRGWRHTPLQDNPRHGYDTMTVYKVDDEWVSFIRPYIHFNEDGKLGAVGFEKVDNTSRNHGAYWYELL